MSETETLKRLVDARRMTALTRLDDPKAWSDLGSALYLSGEHAQALSAFHKALDLDSHDWRTWYRLGFVLSVKGATYDTKGAVEALRKSIAIKPDVVDVWVDLGIFLSVLGDNEGAIEANRRAIALDSENSEAWFDLSEALKAVGKRFDAWRAMRQAEYYIAKDKQAKVIASGYDLFT
jgi:tetratricopeptide (TPR) repeat protein